MIHATQREMVHVSNINSVRFTHLILSLTAPKLVGVEPTAEVLEKPNLRPTISSLVGFFFSFIDQISLHTKSDTRISLKCKSVALKDWTISLIVSPLSLLTP